MLDRKLELQAAHLGQSSPFTVSGENRADETTEGRIG